jgi:hypothetical protein
VSPPHSVSSTAGRASNDPLARVQACLDELAHVLPAQAPLRDFVHHNTLHAYQHLPFATALTEASRLGGARPWLAPQRCRELFQAGRITTADLDAALRQLPALRADDALLDGDDFELRRGDVLRAALLHAPESVTPTRLRWLAEERAVFAKLPDDMEPRARQRLLRAAAADGLDERAAVADLWAAARDLAPERVDEPAPLAETLAAPTAEAAAALWQELLARLGETWTPAELLRHLSGEDFRPALRTMLIRHLAAHLDQGLAAWRNPAREHGFYAAWRHSAGQDWGWEFDEFPGARHEVEQLPDEPLPAMVGELRRLGIAESDWAPCLRRLALELPGWAGMFHRRQSRPEAGDPPVALVDFLAVRLVLERLHAERLLRRLWGVSLPLQTLGDYFVTRPAELVARDAHSDRRLPDHALEWLQAHLGEPTNDDGDIWRQLATRLAAALRASAASGDRASSDAWPLFVLARDLGLCGRELRAIGRAGAETMRRCADSPSDEQRGLLWLLAYEHHYRQQLFAALTANHRRARPLAGRASAQLVLCMDDREEGTRRHLEEVNPTYETFGAAGFYGVPMLWQGLDDDAPTALCPVVVRPENTVHETVPANAEAAGDRHRRRRRWRLAWQERLHQGTRRGGLRAAMLNAAAAPLALLVLLARTLTPGRFGDWLARRRQAFDTLVPSTLHLTATAEEARRPASAEAPRRGFSEDEQAARVGAFLRGIGLTEHFAPLVVIVGHGSDSRNNPHLAAYDCGACSGRHGGPNARVFAAMANRPAVRARLGAQGLRIPDATYFLSVEHNTCDETFAWYDTDAIPASHRAAVTALQRDCEMAARLHAVERCRRFASAPTRPSPRQALHHLRDRRQDFAQARPELGHATVAAAVVGRRTMSRGLFLDRRVFLISYDPLPDADGSILESTLLAAGPVGAGISLEYYFSTVDNEGFGCGSKVMHNLAGLFGVMQGASSDLRTGLPLQMIEVHEAMRLLVVVEQTPEILSAIYHRQAPLRELIGQGWIVLAAQEPDSGAIHLFDPAVGWQAWRAETDAAPLPEVERSADWFAGRDDALPLALLRRPVATR